MMLAGSVEAEIERMKREIEERPLRGIPSSTKPTTEIAPPHSCNIRMREREVARRAEAHKAVSWGEYEALRKSDLADKLSIRNPPKNVCPEPLAILKVEDEKSPETKRSKAFDRIVKYTKFLKW